MGRHNSENFDGAPGMTIQQKMKLKKMRGGKGPAGNVMTPQGGDDKDCTIFWEMIEFYSSGTWKAWAGVS